MAEKVNINKRQHYRIVYPPSDSAMFKCLGHSMRVLDVSEQGLAVERPPNFLLPKNDATLSGKLDFPDQTSALVAGKVLRTDEKTLIILLDKPIPLNIIMGQQRWLLKKFGTLSK